MPQEFLSCNYLIVLVACSRIASHCRILCALDQLDQCLTPACVSFLVSLLYMVDQVQSMGDSLEVLEISLVNLKGKEISKHFTQKYISIRIVIPNHWCSCIVCFIVLSA